jgi:putative transcriptional regulator
MTPKHDLASSLREGLEEAIAWKNGEIALEVQVVDPMPAERVRAIRKKYAKSPRQFELRFGIPARTLTNWEQGRRKPDPASRILLKLIDTEPEAVERAVAAA